MPLLIKYIQWLSALFVVMWSAAPIHVASEDGQQSRDLSAVVVHDIHIHEYRMANALRAFAKHQRMVIGYEGNVVGTEPTIRIDESTSSVADVLNKIVTQAPDYAWKVNDSGAIHVYKTTGRVSLVDVQPAGLLIVDKDRREIWESLEHIPELIFWLGKHHCTRGEMFNGLEWSVNMKKVSLETKGKSLGSILDDVSQVTETYFWEVFQDKSNEKCIIGIYLW